MHVRECVCVRICACVCIFIYKILSKVQDDNYRSRQITFTAKIELLINRKELYKSINFSLFEPDIGVPSRDNSSSVKANNSLRHIVKGRN